MTIKSASILKDGAVATTGGSAAAFTSLGVTMNRHKAFFDGTDHRTRSEVVATTKDPKVSASAPNGYTQARSNMLFKVPKLLANGLYTINTIQVSMSCDVETTQAEKQRLLGYAAQGATDSDFTSFWENQGVG